MAHLKRGAENGASRAVSDPLLHEYVSSAAIWGSWEGLRELTTVRV